MASYRRPLTDPERLDWLRLIRTENVGPVTFFRLLEQFGSAGEALRLLPDLARKGGRTKPLTVASRAQTEREVAALVRLGGRFVAAADPDYPPLLARLDDPPPVLAVLGHPHLLRRNAVALVGARNASLNGRRFAQQMARDLGHEGVLVVSGLARGIDTAAHEGGLATGTVAVMAGGVDVVYPIENEGLYRQIVEQGAVIAECAVGTQPQARHFPRRNRIISGLCLGTVVVEAAPRSGSLITARYAADQGREVFAVPGSPMDPRCQGTNTLIREGATLVQSAADVLQALSPQLGLPLGEPDSQALFRPAAARPLESELDRARPLVLEALGSAPLPVDEVIRGCQLSAPVVLTVILELELAGRVERHPGNQIALLQDGWDPAS